MASGFLAFAAPRLLAQGLALRPALEADAAFIAAVYASVREEELKPVAWSDAEKKAFTDWQSAQQEAHYALHYPRAERLVVLAGEPIGRLYVDTTAKEVRLMEVTLLPAHRNRGLGSALMAALVDYADALGVEATLHVEPFNPAKRMYLRLGFEVRETRGLYEFLARPVPQLKVTS